ncbi:outer membrane beta-barrel protein [Mesonia aquimarina]|uniref:outer membrane beta-barrel protein n=1 Tax=Mesonia aquimarina TaxID=1504967 RepID=UPI000EF5A939|nr:outer membrane beta-barrel protein [Mesonia aquimarina]
MNQFYRSAFLGMMFFAFAVFTTQAQDFSISGTITDDQQIALESATVYVETAKDSTLVTYTITDSKGAFKIEDQTDAEKVNLFISFTGFQTFKKTLSLSDKRNFQLGTIPLKFSTNNLDEVVVKGSRAPVTIKTDTLEFNAASFKTRDDANLEEVLKELPGVSVDSDGNITVNGKTVSRIMINGKEFFGDDPKIATKNLPKEIINKIQVVDTKTKSEEFTGKEGDSENKTINITIDEDKNKGYFSRITAGGGTDERYELSGIGNYFKDELRVSVLASSNNINSSGFTFDEVYDAMGRNAYSITRSSNGSFSINGAGFGGGNGGITKSDNAGINFVNEWDKDAELNTNYFFNRADTRTETKVERENILPDRRYFNNSVSSSERQNDNHRARLSFEIEPDTMTRISVRPNMTVNNGFAKSNAFTESFEADGTAINTAETEQFSEVFTTNFSNNFDVTRKFGTKGAYVRLGFDNTNNESQDDSQYFSSRDVFDADGNLVETTIQDQYIDQDEQEDEYSLNFGSRFPLSEKLFVDLEYDYTKNNSTNTRLVYRADQNTGDYTILIDELSNDFESESFNHRPDVGLVYRGEKLRASVSGGIQNIRLKNEDLFTGSSFDNTYNNFFSNVYFRYKLNKSKRIYFNYRTTRDVPSINQLQPVVNTTNPLNIVTGNPNLKPSLQHRAYMNFNNYDYKTHSGFYTYLSASLTNDRVVSITTTDDDLVRTTTYTNVDGAYTINGGGSLNKTYELNETHSVKLDLGLYGNANKNLGFSNGVKFESTNQSLTPRLELEYDIEEIFRLEPSYSMNLNWAQYSLDDTRDEIYTNHNVGVEITSFWPKKLVFGNDISYRYIGNTAPGFKNSFVLWNMSLGYKILGEDGIVKVKVFDVLDENVSTTRNTGEDFIQDTQQLVLEQYVMFSFTYKFSKFGGKDPNNKRGRF